MDEIISERICRILKNDSVSPISEFVVFDPNHCEVCKDNCDFFEFREIKFFPIASNVRRV